MKNEMTELQKKIYSLLLEFDVFCRQNELEYCLFWGTLLGARRHSGFIPWDDDVDLAMPRESFEKLKRLSDEKALPGWMMFEDAYFIKGCRVPKIRDKRVKIRDKNSGIGVFLDIFPFDYYSKLDSIIIRSCNKGLYIRDYRKKISNKMLRSIYTAVSLIAYLPFTLCKRIYSLKSHPKSGALLSNSPITTPEYFFKEELIYPFKKMKFEGGEFPVPAFPDEVLRIRYGDWRLEVRDEEAHY